MAYTDLIFKDGTPTGKVSVREEFSLVSSPFFGSEQEEYKLSILQALLSKRIVSVLGQTGMSRSSLVCTFCHNIGQYAFAVLDIEWIYYVKVKKKKPKANCRVKELTKLLLEELVKDVGVPVLESEAGIGAYFDAILQGVRTMKALIVFDRIEYLTRSESEEFTVLLSRLSGVSEQVRILLTNNRTLGVPSLAEHTVNLGAFTFTSMVRLVLSYVCRKPLYLEFAGTHPVQMKALSPKAEFNMLRLAISGNQLVSLVGQTGVSRSAVVCGFCHHIREHPNTISGIHWIYYVKAEENVEPESRLLEMTKTLLRGLTEDSRIPEHEPYVHIRACIDAVGDGMKDMKALVVMDRVEYLTDTDRKNLLVILSRLRDEAPHVKVLVTNPEDLGISSLREHIISLGPFNFARTLGLLSMYGCHPPQTPCSNVTTPHSRRYHEKRVQLFRPLAELRLAEKCFSIEDALPGNNSITVLFSAPLVYNDGQQIRPFSKLAFENQRALMWQSLLESSCGIDIFFDNATVDRLLAAMAKRCRCLHYSGHGHKDYLPFEDGEGGPYWFKVDQFKDLIAREGAAPFQLVFVSACYSGLAGESFVAAGVPHVVCVQQQSEIKDYAALAFIRQFYLALAAGHTVRESFQQGRKAVRATQNLKDPEKEMRKFMLLPQDGDHDVPVFQARRVAESPEPRNDRPGTWHSLRHLRGSDFSPTCQPGPFVNFRMSDLSLSARGMMQEDPSPSPPQFFLGREVDMYVVFQAILKKNLVSVVGEAGMGRSSLVCALCHYINERASTILAIDRIYYVKVQSNWKRHNRLQKLAKKLLGKLAEDGKALMLEPAVDMEVMVDAICGSLKGMKALIVFDRVEYLQEAESNEFAMLLSRLTRDTRYAKVLLTNRRTLGIPSLGEHIVSLGPLNFASTVRLFSNLCPHVHLSQDRRRLFENLMSDNADAELFMTDPGLRESTKQLFSKLGDGIPSLIENAACGIPEEEVMEMMNEDIRTTF